ncbi:nucleotide pyrophosphohydrolase [Pseudarthrobacter sp. NamE5]|uniref:nucleotide pyrophosphohydrolase n=1 Tax=Pseudarthrobacter sp. NamE5 TaxID=2576839 RepID=UPI00110A8BFF|nr:nucleotide pyrophosphohydrolase [Pseudarthrobacter sp. NamE5]TLM80931.1 nucleotide pyrophosphohydrolase [Pseudarthrobacter sp. NamE5]
MAPVPPVVPSVPLPPRSRSKQFHTPRNLILALCGEAGELAELVQWTRDDEVQAYLQEETNAQNLRNELADVFSYLLRIADVCGVDLEEALKDKIELNQTRYPLTLAKGSRRKYTQLKGPD